MLLNMSFNNCTSSCKALIKSNNEEMRSIDNISNNNNNGKNYSSNENMMYTSFLSKGEQYESISTIMNNIYEIARELYSKNENGRWLDTIDVSYTNILGKIPCVYSSSINKTNYSFNYNHSSFPFHPSTPTTNMHSSIPSVPFSFSNAYTGNLIPFVSSVQPSMYPVNNNSDNTINNNNNNVNITSTTSCLPPVSIVCSSPIILSTATSSSSVFTSLNEVSQYDQISPPYSTYTINQSNAKAIISPIYMNGRNDSINNNVNSTSIGTVATTAGVHQQALLCTPPVSNSVSLNPYFMMQQQQGGRGGLVIPSHLIMRPMSTLCTSPTIPSFNGNDIIEEIRSRGNSMPVHFIEKNLINTNDTTTGGGRGETNENSVLSTNNERRNHIQKQQPTLSLVR